MKLIICGHKYQFFDHYFYFKYLIENNIIDKTVKRTTPFLVNEVFNTYHSETELMKPGLLLVLLAVVSLAQAGDIKNKLVIQVSTDDLRTQKIALNNPVNLQKLYGRIMS